MLHFTTLAFALLAAAASGTSINDFPKCWRNCVEAAADYNCRGWWDLSCICSHSTLNLLPATITCARDKCAKPGHNNDDDDDDSDTESFDVRAILRPLAATCKALGEPIPASVIRSCEVAATAAPTVSAAAHSTPARNQERPAATETPQSHEEDVKQTTTNGAGQTYVVGIPLQASSTVVVDEKSSTAAVDAEPSTAVAVRPSSIVTQLVTRSVIPVPVSSGAAASASLTATGARTTTSSLGPQVTNGGTLFDQQGGASVAVAGYGKALLFGGVGLFVVVM
ncbi:hypothetical protein W97_00557 [Coniosporium apollinis CBS 100218]|uniref:CFEM domain-containing protein n=1 Tax=Coniosporium apollinis (strain CBS 100218) TaxID=1168221 RepID=R7YHH1_CONA1|nr:uncharacterized protein W97_00557 [Coniosporium apollinis CBS 100218]EON61343.1 hypothetical protein W97_00557 [Coniosporium apollinis CBS 100218]